MNDEQNVENLFGINKSASDASWAKLNSTNQNYKELLNSIPLNRVKIF